MELLSNQSYTFETCGNKSSGHLSSTTKKLILYKKKDDYKNDSLNVATPPSQKDTLVFLLEKEGVIYSQKMKFKRKEYTTQIFLVPNK